jgi:hypothetical protein
VGRDGDGARWGGACCPVPGHNVTKKMLKEARGRFVLLNVVFWNPWVNLSAQQLDGYLQKRHQTCDGLQVAELFELVVGHAGDVAQEEGAENVECEGGGLRREC